MASDRAYLEYILEQLSDAGEISWRPMMGEYVLYDRGAVIGGVYDDRLLLKNVGEARALLPDAQLVSPYPGAKEMLLVEEPEDRELLGKLVRAAFDGLKKKENR